MLNIERLDYILKELQQEKAVYVDKLAKKYYVSESTIRRDLSQLAKEGFLHRTYGGAVVSDKVNNEVPFAIRKIENHMAKEVMASIASRLVKNDMYIVLDSSSTVMHLVKYLKTKSNLRIITTSAQVALNCLDMVNTQVFCTGGWMNIYSGGFHGEASQQNLAEFNTDMVFISARAISMEHGVTDINEEETSLRHLMMRKSKKVVLMCDSTKFDQVSIKTVCPLEKIDYLVTESKPSAEWLEILKKENVSVLYPGMKL